MNPQPPCLGPAVRPSGTYSRSYADDVRFAPRSYNPSVALDVALQLIRVLRGPVGRIRRRDSALAGQIQRSASSVAANLAEGRRRAGKDRLHLYRVAAGSADETRTHLWVAEAWSWVDRSEVEEALALADRELSIIDGLTR